ELAANSTEPLAQRSISDDEKSRRRLLTSHAAGGAQKVLVAFDRREPPDSSDHEGARIDAEVAPHVVTAARRLHGAEIDAAVNLRDRPGPVPGSPERIGHPPGNGDDTVDEEEDHGFVERVVGAELHLLPSPRRLAQAVD